MGYTTGFEGEEDGPGSSKKPGRSSPGDFSSGSLIAWDFRVPEQERRWQPSLGSGPGVHGPVI